MDRRKWKNVLFVGWAYSWETKLPYKYLMPVLRVQFLPIIIQTLSILLNTN